MSRTWIVDENGDKMRDAAIETDFLRPKADGSLEWLLTHSTGFAEVWYGTKESAKIEITTDAVVRIKTAKEYVGGHRLYGLVEGDLLWAFDMAAMGQELQPHLWAAWSGSNERSGARTRPSVVPSAPRSVAQAVVSASTRLSPLLATVSGSSNDSAGRCGSGPPRRLGREWIRGRVRRS
jgi:hypothetical protein